MVHTTQRGGTVHLAGIGLLLVIIGAALYFVPTMIAVGGNKRHALAIFVLNLFLGWSFIVWVIALVWALAAESNTPRSQA